MSMVREWDGPGYDRISGPMEAMGLEVLARLELDGDEAVLDAGCGSGRITQALIERLPRGRVIAVDASPSMADAARGRLWESIPGDAASGQQDRVDIRVLDLLDLELEDPVDAVLSTATFHWISDHVRLFERLHAALRPGGRMVAQCGGKGNIDGLRAKANAVLSRARYSEPSGAWQPRWNYAGPQEPRQRLLDPGFVSAECWLTPSPAQPEH